MVWLTEQNRKKWHMIYHWNRHKPRNKINLRNPTLDNIFKLWLFLKKTGTLGGAVFKLLVYFWHMLSMSHIDFCADMSYFTKYMAIYDNLQNGGGPAHPEQLLLPDSTWPKQSIESDRLFKSYKHKHAFLVSPDL